MEPMNKQREVRVTKPESRMERRIGGTVFGLVEMLLAFRLVFKMLGANQNNGFVHGLYAGTQYIVGTFENIFSQFIIQGSEMITIFEPATLISMVMVALIAWVFFNLTTPHPAFQD